MYNSEGAISNASGIEAQLSAVAKHLHELAQAQVTTATELRAFKERLLDSVESLESRVKQLEKDNSRLTAEVSALTSRQAPLTAPAAWVAIIISGIVAAREFFG